MSDRASHDFDAQIDRVLRAMLDDQPPVDLDVRVVAAIDAGVRVSGASARTRRAVLGGLPALARPAFGLALAAILAIVAVAIWSGLHARAPVVSSGRHATPQVLPMAHAGPQVLAPSEGAGASTAGMPSGSRRESARPARAVMRDNRPAARPAHSWDAALPPLDPPAPIELEPLGAPPIRLAQLEVERLSIEALELDPLDSSQEE
jgi:hypothetical protein